MEPVLQPEEMRGADEATIASSTPGYELMERAAFAVASVALGMIGGAYGRRVVVVAGKGNNGGDGIAASRHLARAGASVVVFLIEDPSGDAARHLEATRRLSPRGFVRIVPWAPALFEREAARCDLVIDAIFGTGFRGAPRGEAAEAIAAVASCRRPVLAVDIPSGVSGTDGSIEGVALRADVTVAIQALKAGNALSILCGRVDVADIGIALPGVLTFVPSAADVADALPALGPDTNKYERGAAAILAASPGMTGAAVLAATSAMRAGAGIVFLGVPRSCIEPIEAAVTEAVKVPLADVEGQLDAKSVDEMADKLSKARVLAVGPGIGRGPRATSAVRRAIEVPLPLVVDADGLTALAEIMRDEPNVLREREQPVVLTPHGGEFERLWRSAPVDRLSAARQAAARWGAVVHLKGRRSITAAPDGRAWIDTTQTPVLATAGSGDVLTGIVTALCARGVEPAGAAWMAACLLGLAGRLADPSGDGHVTAAGVAAALPAAFERLSWQHRSHGPLRTVVESA